MTDIREMATAFEAVKVGMRQSKDGHILSIAIHPNEIPMSVIQDMVGARYQVALVRLGDDSAPVAAPVDEDGKRMVKIAGTLCSDERFQQWMVQNGYAEDMSEGSVSSGLRQALGINSRKDLMHDHGARDLLDGMKVMFVDWLKHGGAL